MEHPECHSTTNYVFFSFIGSLCLQVQSILRSDDTNQNHVPLVGSLNSCSTGIVSMLIFKDATSKLFDYVLLSTKRHRKMGY